MTDRRFSCAECSNCDTGIMRRSPPIEITVGIRYVVECGKCGHRWISSAERARDIQVSRTWHVPAKRLALVAW